MKSQVQKKGLWRAMNMLDLNIENESGENIHHYFDEEEAIKEAEKRKCIVAFY
jgi:hypothetical protein